MESAFNDQGPLAPATVQASSTGLNSAVLVNVQVSEGGEASEEQPIHGALGVLSRPLDPTSDGAAEAICARSDEGLPVVALKDLRLDDAAGERAKGSIVLAGYYGARVSIEVQEGSVSLVFVRGSDLRVPASDVVQGDPNAAQDVALAAPLILAFTALDAALQALAAIPALSAAAAALGAAHTALASYLVPGSPSAPTTRAPGLRGAPGT